MTDMKEGVSCGSTETGHNSSCSYFTVSDIRMASALGDIVPGRECEEGFWEVVMFGFCLGSGLQVYPIWGKFIRLYL